MAKQNKKKQKQRALAGYRLHDKRISQTARPGAIRTIKYELKSENEQATKKLSEAILHDYVYLYGPLDLFSIEKYGNDIPNIVEIWFSFLRRGGVFQPKEDALYNLGKLRSGSQGLTQFLVETLGEDLLNELKYLENQLDGFLVSVRSKVGESGLERASKKIIRVFPGVEEYCKSNNKSFELLCSYMDPSGQSKGAVAKWFPDVIEFFTGKRIDLPVKELSEDKDLKSLTAAFLPELAVGESGSRHHDMEKIIVSRKRWLDVHGADTTKDELIDNMLGINTGTNALSHFLSTFIYLLKPNEESIDRFYKAMNTRMNYSCDEEQVIKENIAQFAVEVEKLPTPKAISKKWGDYRADFNGTISSWIANNVRRSGEIKEQIPALIEEVNFIINDIQNFRHSNLVDDKTLLSKEEKIIRGCEELIRILKEMNKGEYSRFFPLYRDLAAFIRDELNQWGQREVSRFTSKELKDSKLPNLEKGKPKKNDESEQQWHVNKAYSRLCKDLPDIPAFYGENKRIKIEKHKNSLKLIKAGFEYTSRFHQLLSQSVGNVDLDEQDIEKLRKSYMKCTTRHKDQLKNFLYGCMGANDRELLDNPNARFAKSGFERNKTLKEVKLEKRPNLDKTNDLLIDIIDVAQSVHNDKKEWNLLIDTIELAKTVFAINLKYAEKAQPFTALFPDMETHFPAYYAFIAEVDKDETSPEHINRQLQRFVFSEMRGAVQQAAKTRAICRSTIQSMNGGQGSVLVSRKDDDPETVEAGNMLTGVRSRRFYYAMDIEGEVDTPTQTDVFYQIEKSPAGASEEKALKLSPYKVKKTEELFDICSSKHQIQFLRWLCEKPKKKHTRLAMQGGFALSEIEYEMSWSSDLEIIVQPLEGKKSSHRNFLSLPFSVVPKSAGEADLFKQNRFVGVDVGEYGLAVSVIEVHDGMISVLDQIFLNDPQYRALQKEVDIHRKDRQVRATANQVTTRIARLRESVIGSYRNQLHQLSLKYQGRLVFETEISAFETGGQQIKKIYASIKQADIFSQVDAHKMTMNHTWGKMRKDGFRSGVEIGAGGTSRMCTCCNRWADMELEREEKYDVIRIEGYGGRLGYITVNGKKVMLAELKDGVDSLKGHEASRHIYKFMRPPMSDPTKPSAAVHYRINVHHQNDLEVQVPEITNRGNQALYLCPYEDCLHFSDADLQASFTIALKRHLRELSGVEGFYDRKDWVEDLRDFVSTNKLPKIGITPHPKVQ